MRHVVFRILVLCLALSLLSGCAAGGGRGPASAPAADGEAFSDFDTDVSTEDLTRLLRYNCSERDTGLGGGQTIGIDPFVAAAGRLWSTGVEAEYRPGTSGFRLLSVLPDGSGGTDVELRYPDFSAAMWELYETVIFLPDHWGLLTDGEGLYSLDFCRRSGGAQDADRCYYFLSRISADGQCADPRALPLPETTAPYDILAACLVQDTVWLATEQGVWRLPAEGEARLLPTGGSDTETLAVTALLPQPDGSMLALARGTRIDAALGVATVSGWYLGTLTSDGLGTLQALPGSDAATAPALAVDADGTLWMWDSRGIRRLDADAGTAEAVCSWLDSGIDADTLLQVLPAAGGFLAFMRQDDGPLLASLLTPADPDSLADRTIVTLALTQSRPALEKGVLAFNRSQEEVFVQTVDYGVYGYAQANELLTRDILAGTAPDLLPLPYAVGYSLLQKGVYCDLYPLLDADGDLSRQDLVPCALAAGAYQDTLATLHPFFYIETLAGPASLVGDTPGWDFTQFSALCEAHPTPRPIACCAREQLASALALYAGSGLVDYAGGTCRLDSSDMVAILEHCAGYPSAETVMLDPREAYAQLQSGESLLAPVTLGDVSDLRTWMYVFDGSVTFIGYPSADGGDGFTVDGDIELGISAQSENKDAAWQFLRSLLLPDTQRLLCGEHAGLPANRAVLEEQLAAQQSEQQALPGILFGPTDPLARRALTDGELAPLRRLLDGEGMRGFMALDWVVGDIIEEEAAPFFAGDRTAEDAAKIMQDRVQTYLAEQE